MTKAVGLRELKNRLSHYVAEVRRGAVVLVTDRGTVVAEIRPPGLGADAAVPRGLQRMAERGVVTIGLPHDPSVYRTMPPRAPDGTAKELIDADRRDRDPA